MPSHVTVWFRLSGAPPIPTRAPWAHAGGLRSAPAPEVDFRGCHLGNCRQRRERLWGQGEARADWDDKRTSSPRGLPLAQLSPLS
eukprot:5710398-Pyramimonas_sp.AAC.1